MRSLLRRLLKDSVAWKRFSAYRKLPLRQRFFNWFVHRWIYGVRDLSFSVSFTSRVVHPGNIKLGANVWYQFAQSGGCYIQAANGIEIGADTLIAPGVKIVSANHSLEDHRVQTKGDPIRIGERCWLGANVVVLPGVQLGDEVVVAAGSVVTQSFEARSIIAGAPARVVGNLEFDGPVKPLFRDAGL